MAPLSGRYSNSVPTMWSGGTILLHQVEPGEPRYPLPEVRDADSSLSTNPESLTLNVWSKSLANRYHFFMRGSSWGRRIRKARSGVWERAFTAPCDRLRRASQSAHSPNGGARCWCGTVDNSKVS